MAPTRITNCTKHTSTELCNFEMLIYQNNLNAIKKVMKSKSGKNVNLIKNGIISAIENGNYKALRVLLTSPLSNLFEDDKPLIICAVEYSEVDVPKLLLADNRFDVNLGDSDGRTPLIIVCSNRNLEMVKALLHHPKIDVNAKEDNDE